MRLSTLFAILVPLAMAPWGAAAEEAGPRTRLDPSHILALVATGPGAGSSGVAGIRTRVLKGDPTKPGLYTIQLEVPANTRIEAHEHPDDRIATVVSGTWFFGYGSSLYETRLLALPPGSFYTEPPGEPHFARTGTEAVVVQITGVGPTGTRYVATAAPAPWETSLADMVDPFNKTRHAHWNVKGPGFVALHELFDDVAERVEGHCDLLAERVVALGGAANGRPGSRRRRPPSASTTAHLQGK
jgi:quercetin dioxygenase-like cupin family protein